MKLRCWLEVLVRANSPTTVSAPVGKHSSRTAASSVPAHLGRWLKTRCVLFGSLIDGLSGGFVSHPPLHE